MGRHRGEAGEERRPRRKRTAIIGALVAVPLLAAVVAFTLADAPDRSSRAVTPVQQATPEPTYGEYVAPEAGPQAETLAPPRPPAAREPAPAATPRRPAPQQTERPRQRRDCRWEDVPFFERWCRWRGHGDR